MSLDRAYWMAHRAAMQGGGATDGLNDLQLGDPVTGGTYEDLATNRPAILKPITDIPHEIYEAAKSGLNTMYRPKPPELTLSTAPPETTYADLARAAMKRPIGPGIAGLPELAMSPFTGAARSLIGHPLAAAAQVPYEEAKQQVDLAMLGLGPRGGLHPPGMPRYTGPGLQESIQNFLIPPEASGVPETTLGAGMSVQRRARQLREARRLAEEVPAELPPKSHNMPPEELPIEAAPEALEQPPSRVYPIETTPLTKKYDAAANKAPYKFVDLGPAPFKPEIPAAEQAQRYVVARGQATGVEHMVAIGEDGKVVAHGHGATGFVGATPQFAKALYDPTNSLVIHHNHPSNTSFSAADLSMLGPPGVSAVWAYGHDGAVYRAALRPEAREAFPGSGNIMRLRERLRDVHDDTRDVAYMALAFAVREGRISLDDGKALQVALASEIMDRAGIIDYRSNVETAPMVAELGLDRYVSDAVDDAARRFYGHSYLARPTFDDRRSEPLRHGGDLGATFDPAPIAPGEYAGTPAVYQQRRKNAGAKARVSEQLSLPGIAENAAEGELGGFAESRASRLRRVRAQTERQIPVETTDQPTAMNPRATAGSNQPTPKAEPPPPDIEPLTVNKFLHPDYPAQKPRSRNVEDIARDLQEHGRTALAALGIQPEKKNQPIRITEPAPETDEYISRAMASEIKQAIERGGSASDWYTQKVKDAMAIASLIYPEIATDPKAKLGFTAALAITSQGETVSSNVRLADVAYKKFRDTGRFPTDVKADAQIYMNGNFEKLNDLVDEMGVQGAIDFLNREYTVKELTDLGYDISGENMGTKVNGSSIFGAKIGGGFYQNLSGNYDPVTMDLWFMRGWGRLTGTLQGKADLTKQRARFEAALRAARQNVPRTMPALEKLAAEIERKHEVDFRTNRAAYDAKVKKKSELTNAAQRLLHGLNGINETPTSGGHRAWIRERVNRARELLAAEGHNLTNADLQAIWWYPEKELYAKLGGRDAEGINTDYASALRELARKQGISDEAIARAMGAAHNGPGSAAAADVAAGEQGGGSEGSRLAGAEKGRGEPAAAEAEPVTRRKKNYAQGGAADFADGGTPFDFDTAFPAAPKSGPPSVKPSVVKPDLATGFNFEQAFPAQKPAQPPVEMDVLQSIPRGLMRGAREFFDLGMGAGLPPESKVGLAQYGNKSFQEIDEAERQAAEKARGFSRGVQARAEEAIGIPSQAATGPGRIAEDTASFFGNPVSWLGPEGWGTKAVMAGTSGLGSSLAGEAARGTKYELPARIAGAVAAPWGASRAVAPRVRPEVQRLLDAGVDRMTIGQLFPGPNRYFKGFEDNIDSFPILGAFVKRGRDRSVESFQRAVGNQALEPIGQSISRRVSGHELVSEVEEKLGNAYNSLLPHLEFVPDKQFAMDINRIHTGRIVDLPEDIQRQFGRIVERNIPQGAKLDGELYKKIEGELNRQAKGLQSSSDYWQRELGGALGDVVTAMRQGLERSNPGYGAILADINKGWAMYARMRDAATRAPSQTGQFTPAQLLAAIKAGDRSVSKGSFAKGEALMQAFAEAGQKVLPSKVGDSGTAGRLLHTGILGGLVGGEHYMHLPLKAMAATAAAGLTGAAPYTNAGQAVLNRYVRPGTLRSLYREAGTGAPQVLRGAGAAAMPGLTLPGLNPYAQP